MQDKYYQFDKLKEDNKVIHFYTKRPYNFSRKYVEAEKIKRQLKEIEKDFDIKIDNLKYMKQAHASSTKIVDEGNMDVDCYEEYDGMLTNLKGVALTTITADCQAIFLYDPKREVIGNIHSGWKGTLKRIGRHAIEEMKRVYGCKVEDIQVFINPSILKCCFEVEVDVVNSFKEEFSDVDKYITIGEVKDGRQKYYIDTVGINEEEFLDLGIKKENINLSGICTKCNCDIFHSYRVEGIGTGQNLAFIMLKK